MVRHKDSLCYCLAVQRPSELGVDTESNARTDQRHPNPRIPRDQLAFCIPLAQHCEQKCERVRDWHRE
jgi:hypothetical protein